MSLTLLFIACFVAPIAVGYVLRKTRWWWTPSAVLVAGGVYLLATLEPTATNDRNGWSDFGNLVQSAFAISLFVLAAILAALGLFARHALKKAHEPATVEPQLPVAIAQSASSAKNAK